MNLTTMIRERVRTWMPLEDLLPDQLPAFVRSPAYFFGVIALSSLVLLILSGIVLAAFGPQWWHASPVGHFVNSLHFWCAEAFFFSFTLHLWYEALRSRGRGIAAQTDPSLTAALQVFTHASATQQSAWETASTA